MFLLLAIILFSFLGVVLLIIDPIIGGVIAFGIIAGGLYRVIDLLNDVSKRLSKIAPPLSKPDKSLDALERYIQERDENNQNEK